MSGPHKRLPIWPVCLALLLLAGSFYGIRQMTKKAEPKKLNLQASAELHTKERTILLTFTDALREVLDWRRTQPTSDEQARKKLILDLADRLSAIPDNDLPSALKTPWQEAKSHWQKLATTQGPLDAETQQVGQAAMQQFNKALAEHGFTDLQL
jgi:hypothetical protein